MHKRFLLLLVVFLCFDFTSLAQSVDELIVEGNKAYSASDYEKAASFLQKAIETNKLLPLYVYLKLGHSYESLHQYEAAIILYKSMEDRATLQIYLELITLLTEKLNRVDEARSVWNKLNQKYPNYPESYIAIYKILLAVGDNRGAIDSLKRGMSLFPNNVFLFYKELYSYFLRMKAYDSINDLYNKTDQKIRCELSYFSFITDIVDSLLVQKKEDLARILIKHQIELNCLDEYKFYQLFKCYLAMGDTNAALESGNKLLALNPSSENYYYEIALLEEKNGSITQSLDVYKQLYDNIGSHINTNKFLELFLAVANKYQKEGKYQKAIAVLSDVPYKLSYDPRIDFAIAKQYYLHGDYDNTRRYAEYSLEKYVRQQKTSLMDTNIYMNTGLCYLLMEDLSKAEGEFQKHLNRVEKNGKEEAIRRLRELASENINRPDVEYLLKKYYEQTTEISVHSQGAPIEKPQLIGQMALDSFGTSTKINPESDKAYVLVHSQIPSLRFDSNRNIHQVNQLSSGDWELWLPAGTHILKISADGFQRLELPPMNFGKKRSYEMTIKVAPSTPEP
jgi:tetratricopeptide (TPR) repeat protein